MRNAYMSSLLYSIELHCTLGCNSLPSDVQLEFSLAPRSLEIFAPLLCLAAFRAQLKSLLFIMCFISLMIIDRQTKQTKFTISNHTLPTM